MNEIIIATLVFFGGLLTTLITINYQKRRDIMVATASQPSTNAEVIKKLSESMTELLENWEDYRVVISAQHTRELSEIHAEHNDQLAGIRTRHTEQLEKIQAAHQEKLRDIQTEYDQKLYAMQEHIDTILNKVSELSRRVSVLEQENERLRQEKALLEIENRRLLERDTTGDEDKQ